MKGIWVGLVFVVAVVLATACGGGDDAAKALRRAKLAEGCLINSDCSQTPEPLVCAFQRCHIKCNTDSDCEPGLRCMLGDKPEHICQLPDEVPNPPCNYSSDCPGAQVCGIDGECRDSCKTNKDCVSLQICASGTCAAGDELDSNGQLTPKGGVDGGPVECQYNSECPADEVCRPQGTCGVECKGAKDCALDEICAGSKCVPKGGGPTTLPEHCKNSQKDGDESAVDCGGSCYPCPAGSDCGAKADCASQVCVASKCQEPTCSDGVHNGSETGTDCGGPSCSACPPAQTCNGPSDCSTGICKSGVCVDAGCADGQQNGQETDVDCGGGACPACDGANKACVIGGDCTSGVCIAQTCALPTCSDGITNGKETGQDCGGPDCKACSAGKSCAVAGDCVSKVCTSGACVAASCSDSVTNGNETDMDCGGSDCGKCASGKKCNAAADCSAGSCVGNVCKGTYKLTITPAGSGAGTVKSDVGGIDCGATCSVDILDGTSVLLSATAASTSTFSGWSGGGCAGTGTCSLTLNADTTVTATFGGVAPGGQVLSKPLGAGYQPVHPGGTDAAGNYYFMGTFDFGSTNFGGGPVSPVGADAFIAKYSPSGAWIWSRKLGGAGNQYGDQMVFEPGGDVVLLGRSTAASGLDFGGAATTCNDGGVFLLRLAGADGAYKWSKCLGSNVETIKSAVLDGSGNVVIAGTLLSGPTDFGSGTITAQGRDLFLASFSLATGNAVAAKRFGGTLEDYAGDLARAADGSYALVGSCSGNMDFGGGVVTVGKGNTDQCVLRLTSAWNATWARQLGDTGTDWVNAAGFLPSGKLVWVGAFHGQIDFDSGIVDTAKGGTDIVLARMDPTTGAIEWHQVYGTTGNEEAYDLAVAANGDIVLLGKNDTALSFGGSPIQPTNFCVKLSAAGSFIWGWNDPSWAATLTTLALTPSGGVMFGSYAGGFGANGIILAP